MNNEPLVMSVDEWAQDTDGRQRNCSPAKASCSLQRGIATLRKLPAACSEELQPCESSCESFLQLAAGNRNVRKLPAACSGKSQRAKASCSVQREIATCETS